MNLSCQYSMYSCLRLWNSIIPFILSILTKYLNYPCIKNPLKLKVLCFYHKTTSLLQRLLILVRWCCLMEGFSPYVLSSGVILAHNVAHKLTSSIFSSRSISAQIFFTTKSIFLSSSNSMRPQEKVKKMVPYGKKHLAIFSKLVTGVRWILSLSVSFLRETRHNNSTLPDI